MHSVTVTREMNSDASVVWKVLDDFSSVYKYNPGVKSSNLVGQKSTGIGAQRVCNFYDGTSLNETITSYVPNKGYTIELSDFALPLNEATSHFELESLGEDRCMLSITLKFVPKFGPLGWLMAKVMMRPMLKKALTGVTKGLDDHIDTGQLVGKGGSLLELA
ncbi:MAG: SRPBCC family protein [Pseudomonadota bacterium]